MKIKTWGCRGSLPTPGPNTLRYGGNTTCLEIRSVTGRVIIVDAGSGVRYLGQALRREPAVTEIRFLLTHSHWDHLMGFPFFEPAYFSRYTITFCGGAHAQDSIRRYLSHQMQAPYFPVDFSLLKAKFNYTCDCPDQEKALCCFGSLRGVPVPLNHPNGGYGFKFTELGKTFIFLTDNELGFPHEGGWSRAQYVDFCRGADLLFHDAQYTDAEYERTRGWGHSSYTDATDLAIEAGVQRLGLFHHDPDRTDDDLDRQVACCRERIQRAGSAVACFGVAEGMEIELEPCETRSEPPIPSAV